MLPAMALSMSASLGLAVAASSALADMTWPDWQYPHCGTLSASQAAWTVLPAGVAPMASMVVTRLPTAAETGVMHERVGCPSIWIVHAPQRPAPQPNFVPVMFSTSRSAHSSGVSLATSMSPGLPFTLSLIIALLLLSLATCERERIGARSQGGQRVIGQLDPVCQGRRKEHQCLLCGIAIGDDRSDADRAHLDCPAIVGPDERCIVGRVAGVGKLHHQAEPDRSIREARPELLGEEIRRHGLRLVIAQVALRGDGKELVTPGLFHAILVHEDESVVGKVRRGAEARRDHGGALHELQRPGMRPEERLDRSPRPPSPARETLHPCRRRSRCAPALRRRSVRRRAA